MRKYWPALALFCFLALTGCAGMNLGMDEAKRQGELAGGKPLTEVERQNVELQMRLGKIDGASVQPQPTGVVVIYLCDVLFERDTPRVQQAACGLHDLAQVIRSHPQAFVRIDAHTDSMRSEEDNFILSEARADALKDVLVQLGVDPSRIAARGWGEAKPAASNATEEGRRANRRVTVTLMRNQQASL